MTPRQRIRAVAVELYGPEVGCSGSTCVYGQAALTPGTMTTGDIHCRCGADTSLHSRRTRAILDVMALQLDQALAELGALRDAVDEATP